MCGIIGYKGPKDAAKIIFQGLKKLEYRGYDSWGIGILDQRGNFFVRKNVGKIGDFSLAKIQAPKDSHIGMGHTRWATHGGASVKNAHPIYSQNKKFLIIQNGIVENYDELKKWLKRRGFKFSTDTDTEVIANLIEYYGDVRIAFNKLEGRNAIIALKKGENKLVAARYGSPLIVGVGEKSEYFIASDITAFIEHTNNVQYLDDGQMAIIGETAKYYNLKNKKPILRRVVEVDLKTEQIEKGRYPHFLIKEIAEQKETVRRAIEQDPKQIQKIANIIKKSRGTFFVAAGTAGKVCFLGEYLFSKIAKYHVNFVIASEFEHYSHFLNKNSLMIVVSQSGETADDLEAMEAAKKKGAKILSIVNAPGSTIARLSDYAIMIKAGPERAVASTKATTAQISIIALVAYAMVGKLSEGKRKLIEVASVVNDMLNPRYEQHIKKLAKKLKDARNLYILGRGVNYPIALEAEIKLDETSHIHAEGFAAGELKHYALSLITKGVPVIVFVANDEVREEILVSAKEVASRGAYVIGVGPYQEDVFDYWIRVPDVVPELSPIVNLIPIQILAYDLAILLGNDPDRPRNLAKSVTVK